MLTAGDDQAARLWDAATGEPLGQPMAHGDRVLAARFSPDGRMVLTAGDDQAARLWDAATGGPIGQPMTHGGQVLVARFSPDGRTRAHRGRRPGGAALGRRHRQGRSASR